MVKSHNKLKQVDVNMSKNKKERNKKSIIIIIFFIGLSIFTVTWMTIRNQNQTEKKDFVVEEEEPEEIPEEPTITPEVPAIPEPGEPEDKMDMI